MVLRHVGVYMMSVVGWYGGHADMVFVPLLVDGVGVGHVKGIVG